MSANNIPGRLKNRETAELLKVYKVRGWFLEKKYFLHARFEKRLIYEYTVGRKRWMRSEVASMILLRANTELHQTFERLIEAMKVPVKWNGIFVVIDNYMILQGEVRSLFFHFDTRNVATNIIDIPVKEDEIGEVGTNMRVQNAINLILYAFGKWGTIKGVRVDKSFEQLNTLFTDIMKEMQVEPEYTPSYLRFYRSGMRITYEDVIQTAQEEEQAQPEDEETN